MSDQAADISQDQDIGPDVGGGGTSSVVIPILQLPVTIIWKNYSGELTLHAGDSLEVLEGQIVDATNSPVNMSVFDVYPILTSNFNPNQIANGTFTWVNALLGLFTYFPSAPDFQNRGELNFSLIASVSTSVLTIPTNSYIPINII